MGRRTQVERIESRRNPSAQRRPSLHTPSSSGPRRAIQRRELANQILSSFLVWGVGGRRKRSHKPHTQSVLLRRAPRRRTISDLDQRSSASSRCASREQSNQQRDRSAHPTIATEVDPGRNIGQLASQASPRLSAQLATRHEQCLPETVGAISSSRDPGFATRRSGQGTCTSESVPTITRATQTHRAMATTPHWLAITSAGI